MTDNIRDATLCILVQEEEGAPKKICLAMKKKGFGEGRWNGVGGKVEPHETIEEAAIRETLEEIGVSVSDLVKAATLTFLFPHNTAWNQVVHVYLAYKWEGEPKESDEMLPQWFPTTQIPFDRMWPDDKFWFTEVLNGNRVRGTFTFGEGDIILDYELIKVEAEEL